MTASVDASAAGSWRLGDLTVHRLGFGAMRLTGSAPFDLGTPSDRDTAIKVLRLARELGVNHIDTAAFYFSSLRSANELIHTALSPYQDDLVIATKVGGGRHPWGEWYTATPAQLRGLVEENLRQLGRDHLDVVNFRRSSQESIAEHVGALAQLRDAGLIRHIGVSNVTVEHLAEARAITPVVCVQNLYGLEVRDSEDVLRRCAQLGIAFVPFFSIAGARGPAGARAAGGDNEAVRRVAATHGVSTAQVRIAWTLAQGPHVLAIPGTGDPGHLQENVAAAGLRLTAAELELLAAPRP
ncbi:aldo/keto reductase [Pseudofrankia inefficax]|uniref:Aldo/keto reductase n=1 Tax=Pseudofrankia inefficax (strain DSM 45817 / CECT 9037 / DDB 130130 / EuI1c) TaxID=298654 RepID=E3J1M1_PSEI1|nr:aldo/keto reductase [Pseudofrankia inefficax]ADP81689.1 aldo/keto reductase [Pseudofrankia inefficax]